MRLFVLFLLMESFLIGVANATPTLGDLKKIQAQLLREQKTQQETKQKVVDLSTEIKRLQKKMVQTANAVQAKEEQLSKLETNLTKLKKRQTELEHNLSLSD